MRRWRRCRRGVRWVFTFTLLNGAFLSLILILMLKTTRSPHNRLSRRRKIGSPLPRRVLIHPSGQFRKRLLVLLFLILFPGRGRISILRWCRRRRVWLPQRRPPLTRLVAVPVNRKFLMLGRVFGPPFKPLPLPRSLARRWCLTRRVRRPVPGRWWFMRRFGLRRLMPPSQTNRKLGNGVRVRLMFLRCRRKRRVQLGGRRRRVTFQSHWVLPFLTLCNLPWRLPN